MHQNLANAGAGVALPPAFAAEPIKRQLRLLRYLRWHYTGNLCFPLFVKRRSGHFVACLLFYSQSIQIFNALFAISPELRKHRNTRCTHNDNR